MKLEIRPGQNPFLGVNFSPEAFRRFLAAVVVGWVLAAVGLYILAESAAVRWAPAAGGQTTGLLVAFVWISQLVPFLKRTRSLLGAMRDGFVFAAGLGSLLILAIHFAG
jgi:hypothetical protein